MDLSERGEYVESVTSETIGALAAFGPEWGLLALAFIVTGAILIKGIPALQDYFKQKLDIQRTESEARSELEKKREDRKAAEERSREQRDRERSEMEGRWASQNDRAIHAQEQANAAMESVAKQLEIMNTQLMDSKGNSARIGSTLSELSEKVDDIHREVVRS